jgi:hypothetical protein
MCLTTVVWWPRAPPRQVTGDTHALVIQLDGVLDYARLDLLPQQAMRHRVVMAVDVDVMLSTSC